MMANEQAPKNWSLENKSSLPSDPLLACLIVLTKIFQQPASAHALTAGLPVPSEGLSPELFIRAAERANISSTISRKKLTNIDRLLLPAVLLLKDRGACILTELTADTVTIIQPETGAGTKEVPLKDLEKIYTGIVILTAPSFKFSKRAEESVAERPKNWFWGTLITAWPIYSEVLIASLLINIFTLASPLFVMNVYDRVVPNNATETLWVLASGVFLVFFFDVMLRNLRSYFLDLAGKKVDTRLSAQIFERVMGIRMDVRPGSVGAFSNTVQAFEFFRDFITSTTVTVLVDLPFVFLFIGIIFLIGGTIGFIPLTMVPLVIIIGLILQLPLRKLSEESYKQASEKQATLIESLGGIEAIKSVGAEGIMQRRWEGVVEMVSNTGIKLRQYANFAVSFATFSQQITYVSVVIYGVYLIGEGDLTVGGLVACTILAGRSMAAMSQVASILTRYHHSITSLESLNKVMQMPVEREQNKDILRRSRLKGSIQFKDVNFAYPNQQIPSLNKLSFKIEAGEHVGILGKVGSGKTTIAKLILGLYQPTDGSILIDNVEARQIDVADLRHNIGYVPQDIVLFYGSIKENIVFGKPAIDDSAIQRAATIAGVERFIANQPQGYDLQVGERGSLLSGGQRQTVAIARAILYDPPILIFDEASNSMDEGTESYIRKNLQEYIKSRTFIIITHKASMLNLVDRLIILDNGKVIADGPKEIVLQALKEGKIKVASKKVSE